MSICYIVGAAVYCCPFSPNDGDLVIAADGGITHLKKQKITPHIAVGDWDSLDTAPESGEVMTFPVEKDDTDTMLAIKIGWQRGYRTFHLLAGTGGRSDHTLANLQSLLWLAKRGGRGYLCGKGECFTVVRDGALSFREGLDGTLSVFAVDGAAHGVCIAGTQYPLGDGELFEDFPLGVSNHFTGAPATVKVANGALLVYWQGSPENVN